MLRKIQGILLRKIQISIKIVLQDTEKHLSTSRHDSYNIFCVSKLLDIQQQFYCLIVLLSYCLIVLLFQFSDSLIVLLSVLSASTIFFADCKFLLRLFRIIQEPPFWLFAFYSNEKRMFCKILDMNFSQITVFP